VISQVERHGRYITAGMHRNAPIFELVRASDYILLPFVLCPITTPSFHEIAWLLSAARCHAIAVYAVMRCPSVRLSVCPSVTFVNAVKTSRFARFDVAGFIYFFNFCILYLTVCISYWCNHYYALLCTGQLLVHPVALLSFFIPSVF